jgi:hypothetical protein
MAVAGEDLDIAVVMGRELELQRPSVRHSAAACLELLDPQFREFGVSGRVWDRASVVAMMATERYEPPATEDMTASRLAPDVILLTYRTRRPGRTALRSAIWRRGADGEWRLLFHQGTAQPAGGST